MLNQSSLSWCVSSRVGCVGAVLLSSAVASPVDAQMACPQVFPDTPAIEFGDAAYDRYGSSVAVDGVYAVVGATQQGQTQSTGYAEFLKYDAGQEIWGSLGTQSAGAVGARFGASVAISGEFAVVGAPQDTVGNEAAAGAAYVFKRDANDLWQQFGPALTADSPDQNALFGQSVAISGDWIIVGEPRHDTASLDITDAGAVYLFEYDDQSQTWIRRRMIEGLAIYDLFGWSVAIDGDTAAVGAIDTYPPTAYVLEREGTWDITAHLEAPSYGGLNFGDAVAIHDNLIIIGDRTGVPEDWLSCWWEEDGGDPSAGTAFAYTYNSVSNQPTFEMQFVTSHCHADNAFGGSISMTTVAGMPMAVIGAQNYDVCPNDDCENIGAAHLFLWYNGDWVECGRITSDNPEHASLFGGDVAIGSLGVLIGSPQRDVDMTTDRGGAFFASEPWAGDAFDCDGDGIPDAYAVATALVPDCNGNCIPDSCELLDNDCNGNGVPDECDIAGGLQDCNANGVPDACDIANGDSTDCNEDGIPDECGIDCNGNGIADSCDISSGAEPDEDNNGVPDSCELDVDHAGREHIMGFLPMEVQIVQGHVVELQLGTWADVPGGVTVTIEHPIGTTVGSVTLSAGEVETFVLPDAASTDWETGLVGSNAVRVSAPHNFTCHMVNRSPRGSDAAMAVPVRALGTHYVVATYTQSNVHANQVDRSQLVVVATEDGTEVDVDATANLIGSPSFPMTLHRGQGILLQAESAPGSSDLTGSIVTSNHPVAVTAGNFCANIPTSTSPCDGIFEFMYPTDTDAWGTHFVISNVPEDLLVPGTSFYRIVASVDNTDVSRDGTPILPTLDAGEFHEIEDEVGVHEITATNPVTIVQFMPSNDAGLGNGDPAMMNVAPTSAYQSRFIFRTPDQSLQGAQFAGNFLEIIAENVDTDTVYFDGQALDELDFNPISGTSFSIAILDLEPGPHTTSTTGRHWIYVGGYNEADSYLFSGGMIFGLHGCVGDADGDGITNVDDLLVVLGFWGTAHAGADLNDDGTVDVNDLLMLLGDWGCGDPGAGPFPESFSECLQTYSDPAKQAACIEALIHTGQY